MAGLLAEDESWQLDLRRYLHVIRRRRLTVLLVALGMMAAALLTSLVQDPTYESAAQILVQPRSRESVFSDNQFDRSTGTVETEIAVLQSDSVRRGVQERLGGVPPVAAHRVGETEVMEVRASSGSAARAAQIANAYADSYVEFRKNQAVGDMLTASDGIRKKIAELDDEIDTLERRMSDAPPADRATVEASLRPRYTNLITQQSLLAQKLDQLQVDANLTTGGATVVKVARVPTGPASPKPVRNSVAALLVGLMAGVGFAIFTERLDESFKTKDDLARATDLPVLGVLPVAAGWERPGAIQKSLNQPNSPVAEAFRSLRTSVQLLGADRPVKTIGVTSAVAAEGKSSVVAGLGIVLSMAGQRVVLVDCDLRRPSLHKIFGLRNDVGVTSVLTGDVPLEEAVKPVPGQASLSVITSGPLPGNPSEILASRETSKLLFALESHFDLILVDSPPVLPVTDAIVLATWLEATLLVARARSTSRRELTEAFGRLRQAEANVAGTVLNSAQAEGGYGYEYGYYQTVNGNGDRGRRRVRRSRSESKAG